MFDMLNHSDDRIRMTVSDIDCNKFWRMTGRFEHFDKPILFFLHADTDGCIQTTLMHVLDKRQARLWIEAMHDVKISVLGQHQCDLFIDNRLHVSRNDR